VATHQCRKVNLKSQESKALDWGKRRWFNSIANALRFLQQAAHKHRRDKSGDRGASLSGPFPGAEFSNQLSVRGRLASMPGCFSHKQLVSTAAEVSGIDFVFANPSVIYRAGFCRVEGQIE
jgi:hypothetical protein